MKKAGPSKRALQRAKSSLLQQYGESDWFCGVGIVPTDTGLGLRLNVDPEVPVKKDEIPATFDSIAIEIVPIKGYRLRKD